MRLTTTTDLRALKTLIAEGHHKAAIARQLNRETHWVSDWCRKLNLTAAPPKGGRYTADPEIDVLKELVAAGVHISEIARRIGRTNYWVRDWCSKLNLNVYRAKNRYSIGVRNE